MEWWNSVEELSRWSTRLGWTAVMLTAIAVVTGTLGMIVSGRISTLQADRALTPSSVTAGSTDSKSCQKTKGTRH